MSEAAKRALAEIASDARAKGGGRRRRPQEITISIGEAEMLPDGAVAPTTRQAMPAPVSTSTPEDFDDEDEEY